MLKLLFHCHWVRCVGDILPKSFGMIGIVQGYSSSEIVQFIDLLGQWLNFKLFGITYLVGKIKFKLFF